MNWNLSLQQLWFEPWNLPLAETCQLGRHVWQNRCFPSAIAFDEWVPTLHQGKAEGPHLYAKHPFWPSWEEASYLRLISHQMTISFQMVGNKFHNWVATAVLSVSTLAMGFAMVGKDNWIVGNDLNFSCNSGCSIDYTVVSLNFQVMISPVCDIWVSWEPSLPSVIATGSCERRAKTLGIRFIMENIQWKLYWKNWQISRLELYMDIVWIFEWKLTIFQRWK